MRDITLAYVFRSEGEQVLLQQNKRGRGEGIWTGPGGKVEDYDDSVKDAAIRETREETGISPHFLEKLGEIEIRHTDKEDELCHVYRSDTSKGSLVESKECRPSWFFVDNVPYSEMWYTDPSWFFNVLRKDYFRAEVNYHEETGRVETWSVECSRSPEEFGI